MGAPEPPKIPSEPAQVAWLRWLASAWRQRRPGVVVLTATVVAAWLLQDAMHLWSSDQAATRWLLAMGHIPYFVLRGQWWRLLTSAWAHTDVLHMGVNALMLWILGRPLEAAYGERVPVLLLGRPGTGTELCHFHLDGARVAAALAEVRAQRARDPEIC